MVALRPLVLAAAVCLAGTAAADISVRFTESAPTDRFTIANLGACEIGALEVEIDLGRSAGGLIFDTTGAGAGVQVFQPFAAADGPITLQGAVLDGDRRLFVRIDRLAAGTEAAFTIDVDDTLPEGPLGQTRVTGAEIEGGSARVTLDGATPHSATFDATGAAVIALSACTA